MALFPLETLRINPSTYSGWSAKLPDGSTQIFPSYARAMAAGAKEIQPNMTQGPVSTTEDNDTSAQDFIQNQIDQVKSASGIMNEGKGSGQGPVTPGINRATVKNITTQGQKIAQPNSNKEQGTGIHGAFSNQNEQSKKIRNI